MLFQAVEQIARRHDAKVIRTKANPTALMEEQARSECGWEEAEKLALFSAAASRF